jgi:hypothetical protein
MRFWLLESQLSAIVSHPAPDCGPTERAALEALLADKEAIRGTVMLDKSRWSSPEFRLPEPMKARLFDLSTHGAYRPLLAYMRLHHPEYHFVDTAYYTDPRPALPRR